jgi:hypothetical protein
VIRNASGTSVDVGVPDVEQVHRQEQASQQPHRDAYASAASTQRTAMVAVPMRAVSVRPIR